MNRPGNATPRLVAAVAVAVAGGARTVREVAVACDRSVGPVHGALVEARRLGLVKWSPDRQRTIRPAVEAVRWGAP